MIRTQLFRFKRRNFSYAEENSYLGRPMNYSYIQLNGTKGMILKASPTWRMTQMS